MDPIPTTWYEPLTKLGSAAAGTLVSLRFIQGRTRVETALTVLSGIAFSWFAAHFVAGYLRIPDEEGLVGFLLGLFGMALLAKVYETLQALSGTKLAEILTDWIKKRTDKKEG